MQGKATRIPKSLLEFPHLGFSLKQPAKVKEIKTCLLDAGEVLYLPQSPGAKGWNQVLSCADRF